MNSIIQKKKRKKSEKFIIENLLKKINKLNMKS